jgi:hypothetical protein
VIIGRVKSKCSKESCPTATYSTSNFKRTILGLNSGLRCGSRRVPGCIVTSPLLHLTAVELDGQVSIPDRRSYSFLVGQVQTDSRPTVYAVKWSLRGKIAGT